MSTTTTTTTTTIPILSTRANIIDEEIEDNPKLFTDDEMKIDVEVDSVISPTNNNTSEFKYRKPLNTIPYKLKDNTNITNTSDIDNPNKKVKNETTEDIINKAINYVETFNGVNKKNTRIIFCILLAVLLIRLWCI